MNRIIGVIIGVAGVVILIGPNVLSGLGDQGAAQLAVLGASCSYALAGIYGRRFRGMPSTVSASGMLACTALMMIPLMLLVDKPAHFQFEAQTWGALLGIGILSTAIAYLIYFRILETAGPTNVLLVTFLIPVSSILLGVFILGERIALAMISGMTLISAGLVAVDGRLLHLFSPKPEDR